MTRQRTTLLDHGPAPAIGAFVAGHADAGPARNDALPEPAREPQRRFRRLAAFALRRSSEAPVASAHGRGC